MKGPLLIVAVATRRAETAFTAKGNELKISTMRATVHGAAIRRVATMKHFVNVFDNRSPWMEFVNHMFIIISKNGL